MPVIDVESSMTILTIAMYTLTFGLGLLFVAMGR